MNKDPDTYEFDIIDFLNFDIDIKENRDILLKSYEDNYKNIQANEQFFPEDDGFTHDIEPEFDEQKEYEIRKHIENAHNELQKAFDLIKNNDHPVLKNKYKLIILDAPLIKKSQYYIPENQELYEYLDKNRVQFKSKDNDYLMINTPNDYDKAVDTMKYYDDKYKKKKDKEKIVQREDLSTREPIKIYYFNLLSSLEEIFESLNEVYKIEVKPFKIHFQLSGVFETQEFDFESYEPIYSYEARDITWKNYKSSIPIIVKDNNDLNDVMMYIESVLQSYETSSSNTKLIMVGSISFTISRMR